MANLLDTIRQASQPTATDETQGLQTLLRAKSGKAVGGESASSLGEQQANTQAATNVRTQVLPAAVAQDTAQKQTSAGVDQAVAAQKSDIAQARSADSLESRIKTNQILQNLEQSHGVMDQRRKDSDVAQVAQNLRLQTKQYTDNLQREGQRNRLDDANQFSQELTRATFGDNQKLLEKQLAGKSILDASDNEFRKAMGTMTASQAYEAFHDKMAGDRQRAIYSGLGTLVGAGAGVAGAASGSGGGGAASGPAGSSSSDYTSLPNSSSGYNTGGSSSNDYRGLK